MRFMEIPYNRTNNNDVYIPTYLRRIKNKFYTFYMPEIGATGVELTAATASNLKAIHTAANFYMKDTTLLSVFIQ